MGKKLAIKGHLTRREEVIELLIELLEMMGGKDSNAFRCTNPNLIYFVLDNHVHWDYIGPEEIDKYEIFTLEEFFSKYPFKVGDRVLIPEYESEVRICEMQWDGFEIQYKVYRNDEVEWYTAEELLNYNDDFLEDNHCNENQVNGMKNVLAELLEHIKTTQKEELEREFEEIKEWSNVGPTVEEFMTFCECVNKKPVYPTTYDECCNILNADEFIGYEFMINFPKLINARNAYWKIAGEQMGLDEPWKHNYLKDANTIRYAIYNTGDEIVKLDGKLYRNYILCFPTEEMRDAFYENFKDLIERCKELL